MAVPKQFLNSYKAMIQRCCNPQNENFPRYGGRGITVCDRWRKFANFKEDMYPPWSAGLTLDRIDNNGGYSTVNCRWATVEEQARNKSNNVNVEHNGQTLCITDLAKSLNISRQTLYSRNRRGKNIII